MRDSPRFLLDTSVVIGGWSQPQSGVAISSVTLAELHLGLLATRDATERARRLRALQAVVTTFPVLPFTAETASHLGELFAAVQAAGRNPRSRAMDLQIAACAKEAGAVLVTKNPDDLRGAEHLLPGLLAA